MVWLALFSQTGKEIADLSKAINIKPDVIVTNNFEEKIKFSSDIRQLGVPIQSARHDTLMDYFRNQKLWPAENVFNQPFMAI